MTIPTLISNYTKKQTATKLKQTYSIISQALTMAQSEHGDTTAWEVAGISGTNTEDVNFNTQEVITTFAKKYFLPYLKVAKDYGYVLPRSIGYDGAYLPISNSQTGTGRKYIVLLSNNVFVKIGLSSHCYEYDQDDNCTERRYTNILFDVDINGFQKPNTLGKDVFYMIFNSVKIYFINKRFQKFFKCTNTEQFPIRHQDIAERIILICVQKIIVLIHADSSFILTVGRLKMIIRGFSILIFATIF